MASLEARAASMGIPMQMEINDGIRYSYCDAHMANLISIEGKMAEYAGECANGHKYDVRLNIEDIKRSARIENGEIMYGPKKDFEAPSLEEF